MRRCSLVWGVCLVSLLTIATLAVADDLDASWLVGKWNGEGRSEDPMVGDFQLRIQVKPDGTFEGESQTRGYGALPYQDGKWKVTGDTVTFTNRTYVTDRYSGRVPRSETWILKRAGENLEGSGVYESVRSYKSSLTLKKAK
jgi:hypothetical protein